ncbi:GPI inositol-deacylase [Myxococcota bacterium]|nr:GPI inositol-deacylase [Myxococcota bacterium]
MSTPPRPPTLTDELRAAVRLAVHATVQVTEVVQEMHVTIGGGPALLGRPLAGVVRLVTAPTYGSIKGITGLVGTGLDAALVQLGPLLGPGTSGPERDVLLGALNGVVGDHLEETGSALALPMTLRRGDRQVDPDAPGQALPRPSGRLVLLIHGSSASHRCWSRGGQHLGQRLEDQGELCWLALDYNSGLHISTNGQRLATLLERLVAAWPVPLRRIDLVTHSMGGLVSRAAIHTAEQQGHRWRGLLGSLVFLGSPHHGAPLERGGAWLQAAAGLPAVTAPLARLARLRSAGVTDLRFGNLRDADWQGRDRFTPEPDPRQPLPLPVGVDCFAVAADLAAGPAGAFADANLPGDGTVPVDSALGRHPDPARDLGLPPERRVVVYGASHMDLLDHPQVRDRVAAWLEVEG